MAFVPVQHRAAPLHWRPRDVLKYRRSDVLAGYLVAGISAALLAGCAFDENGNPHSYSKHPSRGPHKDGTVRSAYRSTIPPTLLKPQLPPDCESGAGQPQVSQPESHGDLAQRIRAEYDLACYKEAEARAREQLSELQKFVAQEMKP
jgi:hypothetical protein